MGSSSDRDNFVLSFLMFSLLALMSHNSCLFTACQCCCIHVEFVHLYICISIDALHLYDEQGRVYIWIWQSTIEICTNTNTCRTTYRFSVDSIFAIKLFIGIILQDNCIESMECVCDGSDGVPSHTPWKKFQLPHSNSEIDRDKIVR